MKSFLVLAVTIFGLSINHENVTAGTEWTRSTYELQRKLMDIGYTEDVSKMMINRCKAQAKDPLNCVITGAFIGKSESSACTKSINNNCWGLRNQKFKTKTEAFNKWLKSYNRWWFKHLKPKDFYGKGAKTAFCVDEHSSGTIGWCPNGLNTANKAYEYLTK